MNSGAITKVELLEEKVEQVASSRPSKVKLTARTLASLRANCVPSAIKKVIARYNLKTGISDSDDGNSSKEENLKRTKVIKNRLDRFNVTVLSEDVIFGSKEGDLL